MSTNFPTTLDDATSLPVEAAATALSVNHVTAHQNIQDALEAVEAKVGVDSSAVTTSHDYKLSAVTGSDKALKSGTSTQSVTGLTLASPKITVGSDAVGDLHYTSNVDGTQSRLAKGNDNQILKMNGTALNWEDEITTVNASTTAAGIVELATTAQVTAGTATGETGAALVVTPDALAASTPVFNGSGLTNLPPVTHITTASDNLKLSADTERTQASSFSGAAYSLVKSFQLLNNGTVRLKMETKDASGNGGDARVYRNGVYISVTHAGGATYTAYSDDISGNSAGDFLQVYTMYGAGQTTAVKNVRVYYDRTANILGTVITD